MPEESPFSAAEAYWSLALGERSWGNVARSLGLPENKSTQNRLSRKARDWEQRGFVRHLVLRDNPVFSSHAPRLPDLEHRIRTATGLRDIVVIAVPKPENLPQQTSGNYVHEALGAWAARLLRSQLRRNDVVGVGSGRGVYYTTKSFAELAETEGRLRAKKVISLTGRSAGFKGEANEDEVLGMDADRQSGRLMACLSHDEASPLSYAITGHEVTKRLRVLESEVKDVTLALVGIGSFDREHYYFRHMESAPLKGAKRQLKALAKRVGLAGNTRRRRPRVMVGDICSSFFSSDAKIKSSLGSLNDKLLTIDPENLASIVEKGTVIAVAGGESKASAIEHVLARRWITHLVVDAQAARALVERLVP